jgi:hypothetical protein
MSFVWILKKGEKVVTNYYVTDGKQYISTSKSIHAVSDIKHATPMNLIKASNVIKTIPKTLDNIADWTIQPIPEDEIIKNEESDISGEFLNIETIAEGLKVMSDKAEFLAKYHKSINHQLVEVELKS